MKINTTDINNFPAPAVADAGKVVTVKADGSGFELDTPSAGTGSGDTGSSSGSGGSSNLVPIATIELTANQTTIEFANIPATYEDLQLTGVFNTTGQQNVAALLLNINGDTSYSYTWSLDERATFYSGNSDNRAEMMRVYSSAAGSSVAPNAGMIDVKFPRYAGNLAKIFSGITSYSAGLNGNGGTTMFPVLQSAMWAKTDPITDLAFTLSTGDAFQVGTKLTLWGIAAEAVETGGGSSSVEVIAESNDGWIDPNPPVAHRYWRVRMRSGSSDGTAGTCYFCGLDFLDDNLMSIPGQTWSGAVADSSRPNMQNPSADGYTAIGALPASIVTDLGTPQIIGGVMMQPRESQYSTQAPFAFYVEGCDTNSATDSEWTTYLLVPYTEYTDPTLRKYALRPYIVQLVAEHTGNSGGDLCLDQIEYAASAGGADLTVPETTSPLAAGSIIGQVVGNSNIQTSGLFNNVTGTDQYYNGSGTASVGTDGNLLQDNRIRVEYRFTSRPTLAEVRLTNRGNSNYLAQGPDDFQLRTSRDGIHFTTFYSSPTGISWTSGNQVQAFALPATTAPSDKTIPDFAGNKGNVLVVKRDESGMEWAPKNPGFAAHKYWRVFIPAGVSEYYGNCIAEITMAATPGGANQCTGGTAFAKEGSGSNAFDGNPATYWQGSTAQSTNGRIAETDWVGYQFASPVVVTSVTLTSRNDGSDSGAGHQCPKSGFIQYSDDGLLYHTAFDYGFSTDFGFPETRVISNPAA